MAWEVAAAKQDTEDDFCVNLVLGGTTIGSWRIMPTYQSCKKWHPFPSSPTTGIPSASAEERLQERQNEGCVPECTTSCGLCCPKRGSSAKPLRSTRDGLIWEQVLGVCVCNPFVVLLCGSIMWATSLHLNIGPLTGSIPVLFHVCLISTVYWLPLLHLFLL